MLQAQVRKISLLGSAMQLLVTVWVTLYLKDIHRQNVRK